MMWPALMLLYRIGRKLTKHAHVFAFMLPDNITVRAVRIFIFATLCTSLDVVPRKYLRWLCWFRQPPLRLLAEPW